jgi:transcriptional regulator with XRE-family HTH domain
MTRRSHVVPTGRDNGPPGGPVALRLLLGAQLRRLREERGVSREDAGYAIRSSESKISRMELGRVSFKERDVADLLTLYGLAEGDERARLILLARDANAPGWWYPYRDVLPTWFQSYLGLEEAAALIRTYEVQFIPGLLQTSAYARAVVTLSNGRAPAAEIDRRVNLRMTRQAHLIEHGQQIWAVLDEAALRRPIGGLPVLREQIASLIKATELPNVRLQVVPFHVGGHAAAGGAFSILRFPAGDLPDVVYIEQLTGAMYLDKRDEVEMYQTAMERLCVEAEPPENTGDILATTLRDLESDQ